MLNVLSWMIATPPTTPLLIYRRWFIRTVNRVVFRIDYHSCDELCVYFQDHLCLSDVDLRWRERTCPLSVRQSTLDRWRLLIIQCFAWDLFSPNSEGGTSVNKAGRFCIHRRRPCLLGGRSPQKRRRCLRKIISVYGLSIFLCVIHSLWSETVDCIGKFIFIHDVYSA